jgi:RNA polymerase sigma factor (sigma-70 family)
VTACLQRRRGSGRANRRRAAERQASATTDGDPLERAEARRAVREALGRLRGSQRLALVLRYGFGLSVAEIAELLDVRSASVKQVLRRAVNRMRGSDDAGSLQEWLERYRSGGVPEKW